MRGARFGKVGVLAGGPSNEREISLRSGKAVYNALMKEGVDVIFLDIQNDICDIIKDNKIDVAFIALHGRFGEDGTVQKILSEAGIPYTGSGVRASQLALDKARSKEIFVKAGIPTPGYIVLDKDNVDIKRADILGFPLVVKPQFEGSSIGLSVVKDKSSLNKAIEEAFRYGSKIVLEEYIDGRELTVGILGDEPLPVIEIVTKLGVYDYRAKYSDPETKYLVPAPIDAALSKKIMDLGKRAHDALGCRSFSRVDVMMDNSADIFVLEVNTIPGMTERSLLPKAAQSAGLSFGDMCIKIIEMVKDYEATKKN